MPKQAICENCKHTADEHTHQGCLHLSWKNEGTDNEKLNACSCTLTYVQVLNQKSNQ